MFDIDSSLGMVCAAHPQLRVSYCHRRQITRHRLQRIDTTIADQFHCFDGNASISGRIRSSGSGNTTVEDLPPLDMSASVCR